VAKLYKQDLYNFGGFYTKFYLNIDHGRRDNVKEYVKNKAFDVTLPSWNVTFGPTVVTQLVHLYMH